MKKLQVPIATVTLFVIFYNALPWLGAGDTLILILFGLSPIPVIWMAFRILKDGTPSGKQWDDHFYDDHPYRRNGKEESGMIS